ncbi:LysR family transcriptional regulator [Bacillus sp. FJAT-53711]|uniref:LysR family transcriptional regulator n=1 Tax=Bacillus yunxiaonensis TaxID=3127665 RepID=A0ABU8FXM0_9BACI
MNIEQLEYIVEVTNAGSLTIAAQNMHVTLSAISQSISALEAELGISLFTRSRLGTIPTAEGRIIIKKAAEALEKIQELKDEAHGFANTVRGELRIATIPGPMPLLVHTVTNFKKDYPNVKIEIFEKGSQEILDDIRQHKIDMGLIILFENIIHKSNGLLFEPLLKGKMVIAVNRNSPLAFNKSITPEELLTHSLVLYKDDYMEWFMNQFTATYGPADILFTTNNTDAIQKAIGDGLAITIGPDYSFPSESTLLEKDVVMIELESPKQQDVYFAWARSEGKHYSQICKNFITRLKHEL